MAEGYSGDQKLESELTNLSLDNRAKATKEDLSTKIPDYVYIETDKDIQTTFQDIRNSIRTNSFISVDCEGVDLSRRGKLTVISVGTREKAYIFDVQKMKNPLFDSGLRSMLEDKHIKKLMFDCREDSDALKHLFNVTLDGVLDIQLLEVMKRSPVLSNTQKLERRSERHEEVTKLYSLLRCLEDYIEDDVMISKKRKGKGAMEIARNVWEERPLSSDLLMYVSVDVLSLFMLFDKFKPDGEEMRRLEVASNIYINLKRSKSVRNYNEYEGNKYLPIDVIPPKGSLSFETGFTQCTTCQRHFPRNEFSNNQLKQRIQKCRTCKKIKNDTDVRVNRESNWERDSDRYDCYYDSDDFGCERDFYDSDDYDYDDHDYYGWSD